MGAIDLTAPTHAQLLALDLDGTVLGPDGHCSPRTRGAIRAVVASGIRVCLCTGRTWLESQRVIAETGLAGPGVFVGGAVINEMAGGAILARMHIDPQLARDVVATMHDARMAAMAYQAGDDHGDVDWLISAEHPMPPGVQAWLDRFGSRYRRVEGLAQADHAFTVRISTDGTIGQCDALAAQLLARFCDRIYLHQITMPNAGFAFVEVFDAAADKWRGLLNVARLTGIDPRAIIAVGDDVNDLPMLRHAAAGIAMGNATPRVRELALRTIGSNAADGLAIWLEQLIARRGELAGLRPQ